MPVISAWSRIGGNCCRHASRVFLPSHFGLLLLLPLLLMSSLMVMLWSSPPSDAAVGQQSSDTAWHTCENVALIRQKTNRSNIVCRCKAKSLHLPNEVVVQLLSENEIRGSVVGITGSYSWGCEIDFPSWHAVVAHKDRPQPLPSSTSFTKSLYHFYPHNLHS